MNKTNSALKKYGDSSPFYVKMRTSASVLALLAVGALPVYAQEDEMVEEVVVTGMKASIKSAQDIKQSAEQVVDSITAVDIGALPDRSVSEALQRIPGVQLQRTSNPRDPARLSAEGGGVFVRGLGWVRTELNGRDIFSANNGRSLGFEDVSADLMAGVDVYKNPTAAQIEGGLGGTVDLRTRLPFDSEERIFAGTLDYNHADMLDEGFTSTSALYSDRWEIGGGEMGFLFSASLAEIGNRTDAIQTGRYDGYEVVATEEEADPENGTYFVEGLDAGVYYMPGDMGFRRVDWHQDRNSFYSALQWAPSESLTITAQGLRAEASPKDVERATQVAPTWWVMNPTVGTFAYNDENEVTGGVLPASFITTNIRQSSRKSVTSDFSLSFEYTPTDSWAISGDLQQVKSSMNLLDMTLMTHVAGDEARVSNPPDYPNGNALAGALPMVAFDLTSPKMVVGFEDEALMADPSQYFWGAAMDHIEDNEANSLAGKLDAEYSFDDSSFVTSVKFGARVTDKDAITRQSGYNWGPIGAQFWGGEGNAPYVDSVNSDQAELYTYDDFMRGDVSVPTVGWFATEQVIATNFETKARLHDVIDGYGRSNFEGWYWQPLRAPEGYGFEPRSDNVSAGINRQNEKTQSIYAMARFGSDDVFGVPFDGNIGVRVVNTETTSWGRSVSGGPSGSCGADGASAESIADCASAEAFQNAYVETYTDEKEYSNSYTNVLPSLNLRFMLSEELQLRAGLSQAMVRPSFSQTRPYSTLNFDFLDRADGPVFNPANAGFEGTGNGGAPSLEPTMANQFDMSMEWYFADSSSLSGAIFYKDISDYIKLESQLETHTYGGETHTFLVTRQTNAENGTLKGFELAYSQFFEFLPTPFDGLGVQANYTYIDNEGGANTAVNPFDPAQQENANNAEMPIEGMSKSSYNLAVMYEKYDVSARLAYNWRERYLLTTSAANMEVPTWMNDYGQLDGSVFYTVSDHLKIGLQASNLLREQTEMEVGYPEQVAPYSWTDSDRRIAFVVRWNL